MKFYLRLEAVNLDNFVYDCQDLSTVRGGGLLLLRSVQELDRRIASPQLERVSTGASSGLFEFNADDREATALRDRVEQLLSEDEQLKHATFVVDVFPASAES